MGRSIEVTEILERYASGERDFTELDLDKETHDFSGAILAGANFSGSFIFADFSDANLAGADFSNGNVKTCNFSGSDLTGARFRNTAMDFAIFTGANLRFACFDGASEQGGNWSPTGNTASTKNLNRRRCLRIGSALLKGPSAIFPPASIDDYGWLEADFRLMIKWPGNDKHESLQVFCDDSMNRDENYLAPMIRRCVWNRSADMASTNPWPSVTTEIGHIRENSRVDAILRDIQRKLSSLPFAELGLSTQRDVADIEMDHTEPEFSVWARNGVQSIKYWSVPVAAASLGVEFRQVHADLLAEMTAISPNGWRERYDYDLRQEPRAFWDLEIGANPIADASR